MKRLMLAVALWLAAAPAWAGQAVLTWTDNSTNETTFNIKRKSEACAATLLPFAQLATVGPNTTTYTDLNLVEGQAYCWAVTAANAAGESPLSNSDGKTVGFTVPASPSLFTAVVMP